MTIKKTQSNLSILDLQNLKNKCFAFHGDKHLLDKQLQFVFSGGGFTGYHGVGMGHFINNYMNIENIKGIIGASCGALCAVYIACNVPLFIWHETSQILRKEVRRGKSLTEAIYIASDYALPQSAHELCNRYNVEIVATKVTWFGFQKKIFSNFTTREEVLQCLCASTCLPYLINWKFPYSVKIGNDYYIDGGIVDNVPIKKNCPYDQVVVKSYNLIYPLLYRFTTNDKNIHRLMIQGAEDLHRFINVPTSTENNTKVIKLYEKNHDFTRRKNDGTKKLIYNTIGSLVLYFGIIVVKDTFYWTI